jgi:hypothetical protein
MAPSFPFSPPPPPGPTTEERQQRIEEERALKEAQDAEYEATLAMDKAKAESLEAEDARQLAMLQQMAAEEEDDRALEAIARLEADEQRERALAEARAFFVEEPDESTLAALASSTSSSSSSSSSPSSAPSVAPTICTLHLRLPPPNPPLVRKFLSSHTIRNVLAVVKVCRESLACAELEAVSIPCTVHSADETLTAAGLVPRASLIIRERRDADEVDGAGDAADGDGTR